MLDWITNTVSSLGYVGIALLMFLENVFPPIPSELIMPLAGFTVNTGELRFSFVVIAGVVGSILGALPWYYLGIRWRLKRIKKFADRHGKWLTITGEDVVKAKNWFDKRGYVATCFGRLVPGIRTYVSVPAGISKMNFGLFLLYSTLGTAAWVSLLTYAGYLLGANYSRVEEYLGPVSKVVIAGLIAGSVVWIVKRKRRKNLRR
ncbi:MAG: DedA family protein [Cyanophyceae cyanobacterium]